MDIFDSIGQSFPTIFPAVLLTSAMATLFLGLIFATTRLIGNRVNPRLIYILWLLLGLRMCLLVTPFEMPFLTSIVKYLALGWAVGAVGIFSFYCLQYFRNYRDILRHETKLPEWLHSLFLEVRKDLKVPVRPTLIVTDTDCEPLLMGTFRPVVVLPQRLVEANENSRELLRQVLRHEMTHLSGCDLWLAWLWTIAISLHWFNPLIWKAKSSFGLWREIACDWRVTSRMSDLERLKYGQTLLTMAQNSSSSIFNGAVFVSEKSCDIERRISMISKNFREMKSRFFSNFSLVIVAAVVFTATLCMPLSPETTALAADKIAVDPLKQAEQEPPKIIKMVPENGAKDVDPEVVKELKVTFDRDMNEGMAWCGGGPAFPITTGKAKWINKRTCVLPVDLVEGKSYYLFLNAGEFKGFVSEDGAPCDQQSWKFSTKGEPRTPQVPKVVNLLPANGAKDVDPEVVKELKVTFDCDMHSGFAWCGGGTSYPKTTGNPEWIDKRTCVLPVKLVEGKSYWLSINAKNYYGFMSVEGVSCDPVPWKFSTKGEPSADDSSNNDKSEPPKIIELSPENGVKNVDAAKVTELRVTFDRDMGGGMSWCGSGPTFPGGTVKAKWIDKRTCVMPVKLKNAKHYLLSINSKKYKNFKSVDGIPCKPVIWRFSTGGKVAASEVPKIIEFSPANGAKDLDPKKVTELQLTFDHDMSTHRNSWMGGGPAFPKIETDKAKWISKRTCIVPVKLEEGKSYRIWINADHWQDFFSRDRVPCKEVVWRFSTIGEPTEKPLPKGNPIPLSLLKSIQKKRAAVSSADYTVKISTKSFYNKTESINKSTSKFKFQGNDQWFVDISEIMRHDDNPTIFQGGCDGTDEWSYYISEHSKSFKIRSLADIDIKNIKLLDPFGCESLSPEKLPKRCDELNSEGWEYLGLTEKDGRKLHHFHLGRETINYLDIWIDSKTLLPACTCATSEYPSAYEMETKFQIHSINKKFSEADFQPENEANLKPEKVTELEFGYDEFFVTIDDGADGRMTVRLNGQYGKENGTRSSGLN